MIEGRRGPGGEAGKIIIDGEEYHTGANEPTGEAIGRDPRTWSPSPEDYRPEKSVDIYVDLFDALKNLMVAKEAGPEDIAAAEAFSDMLRQIKKDIETAGEQRALKAAGNLVKLFGDGSTNESMLELAKKFTGDQGENSDLFPNANLNNLRGKLGLVTTK